MFHIKGFLFFLKTIHTCIYVHMYVCMYMFMGGYMCVWCIYMYLLVIVFKEARWNVRWLALSLSIFLCRGRGWKPTSTKHPASTVSHSIGFKNAHVYPKLFMLVLETQSKSSCLLNKHSYILSHVSSPLFPST